MPQLYRIKYYRSVSKDLRKIDPENRSLIISKIRSLVDNPRPDGVVKLQVEENLYRVRLRDFRIIFEIHDHKLVIIIVKIGHRSRIYE